MLLAVLFRRNQRLETLRRRRQSRFWRGYACFLAVISREEQVRVRGRHFLKMPWDDSPHRVRTFPSHRAFVRRYCVPRSDRSCTVVRHLDMPHGGIFGATFVTPGANLAEVCSEICQYRRSITLEGVTDEDFVER